MKSVKLMVKEYYWTCPDCESFNWETKKQKIVECHWCHTIFKVKK